MSSQNPIVTVCVPAYNYAHFLPKAIESVLNQSFTDYEILVINDVSTDNTHEVLTYYANLDSRVRYISNEVNLGAIENCNKCVALARGKYIAFLSADDFFMPNWLHNCVNYLEKNSTLNLVYGKSVLVDDNNNYLWTTAISSFRNYSYIGRDEFREHIRTGGSFFHLAATVMRKSMLENWGFYTKWEQQGFSAEDWEANLRYALNCEEGFVDGAYYAFRVHSDNFSSIDKMLKNGSLIRSHLYNLEKFVTPETEYRLRGVQNYTLQHVYGQINMLQQKAPEIAQKVLPEIATQINNITARLKRLGNLPIPELSENPLISVIIPTINVASMSGSKTFPFGRTLFFVLNALESLLNQTYKNWQVIIVNDGGEDIEPFIEDFKQKHQVTQNIKYFYFNVNQGQAKARNIALEFIWQGELVTFLDDDDLYLENHLETLVDRLKNTNIPCAYTRYIKQIEDVQNANRLLKQQIPVNLPESFSKDALFINNYIPLSAFAVRRECILDHELRFDESLKILEDWDFLLCLSQWYDFTYIPEVTVECRQREYNDGVSQLRADQYAENCNKIYKKYPSNDNLINQRRNHYLTTLEFVKSRLQGRNQYKKWRELHQLTETNVSAYAYKMNSLWKKLPSIGIAIQTTEDQKQLFLHTIDSLKHQIYKNFDIVVIANYAQEQSFDNLRLNWIQVPNVYEISLSSLFNADFDWVTVLPNGIYVDWNTLLACVEHINNDPLCTLIYANEGSLGNNMLDCFDSVFKSDFNVELFRCYPQYLGQFALLKRTTALELNCFEFQNAWQYDSMLKMYEAYGEESIGHVQGTAVHYFNKQPIDLINNQNYSIALSNHCQRFGLSPKVAIKSMPHNPKNAYFELTYDLIKESSVGLVLNPTAEIIDFINEITSILNYTQYQNYQFILCANRFNASQESVFIDIYCDLSQQYVDKILFVEDESCIEADYILELNGLINLSEKQASWLNQAIAFLQHYKHDYNAVRFSLTEAKTQEFLGLFKNPLEMANTVGLFDRRLIAQKFLNLNKNFCLMRKNTFLSNLNNNVLSDNILYVPQINLTLSGNTTLVADEVDFYLDNISYSKELSLTQPFELEMNIVKTWISDYAGSPRVLDLTQLNLNSCQELAKQGLIQVIQHDVNKSPISFIELNRLNPEIILISWNALKHVDTFNQLKNNCSTIQIILVLNELENSVSSVSAEYRNQVIKHRLQQFKCVDQVILMKAFDNSFVDACYDILNCDVKTLNENVSTDLFLECLIN